jgi:thiamine-phosphate pyrophosphorylase
MPSAANPRTPPRLLLVSDGRGDASRLADVVAAAIDAGVRAVQLREPSMTARELAACCARLQPLLAAVDGLLFVNDRVDVAAAGCCDGAQVGHRSLPPAAARRALGPGRWLGVSAHDAGELAAAAAAGADFALLSPVWPTASKPGAAGLGVAGAAALTAAAALPVLWLGGVTAARVAAVAALPAAQRPRGFAAIGAVFAAREPAAAAAELLRAIDGALGG